MRIALVALLLAGCGQVPEDGEAQGPGGLEPAPAEDPSQFLSPVPAWRGYSYAGPEGLRVAFEDAVGWWGERGRDLGAESEAGAIRVVDMGDRPGPYGEWALVHYRGDDGADIRIFEGALTATAEQLRTLMRHELGHVIGLQHSRDPRCLMWGDGISTGDLCAHEIALLGR